jgi:SsrA-binding protein
MTKAKFEKNVEIRNREASFNYRFIETWVAGIVLQGTEIKSVRTGKVNMTDAFCTFKEGELYLVNMHIAPYDFGNIYNHQAKADRKLLLKRSELKKMEAKLKNQGLTIVPVKMFTADRGWLKVEIALAQGKKNYDKREDIKERDTKRELQRKEY